MSSALAMVLMAGMVVPGNGPEKVSGEVEQRLDLCGEWKGTWEDDEGVVMRAFVSPAERGVDGVSILGTTDRRFRYIPVYALIDEGHGRLQMTANCGYFGIYKVRNDIIVIAFRLADEGYPVSFRGGNGQNLLILHRVKPRK